MGSGDLGAGKTETLKRLQAVVHGRVQGVNFRYYTLERARALGLRGYVRNHWDGTVHVVAEGPEDALQRLLSWLQQGPPFARVDRVERLWLPATGEHVGFEVRG